MMFFIGRVASGDTPAGITVSRTHDLPEGEFQLDEYVFRDGSLWFIRDHSFSASERAVAAAQLTSPAVRQLLETARTTKEQA